MSTGQWVLLALAAVAALVAAGLWYWRSRIGSEMAIMAATQTSRAADVAAKTPGTLVEVKGTLRADAPLTSEFAKLPCIYYRALTEAEVERTDHDADGKRETKREYETLSDVVKFAPAAVEDASGRIAIDLESAKVEAKQVHRSRQTEQLNLASAVGSLLNVSGRTIAHRLTEWIIPPDASIYVLGTVLAGGKIGKGTDKKQPFIVSIKSEEERAKSLGRTRLWALVGTVVAAIVALVLLASALGVFGG